MIATINEENARGMIAYIADIFTKNKSWLCEIDAETGDGDHGIGMAIGMQKAAAQIYAADLTGNVYRLFEAAGKAMLTSMGGASGVLFGSFFMSGAKGMEPKAELTSSDFADMLAKGLNAVKERGKAQIGDKTMVDALEPAIQAARETYQLGFLNMLKAAESAALAGVEKTKHYQAKFGRAKSLMERAIGHQDAGASSVWLIFRSMREYIEKIGQPAS